MVSAEFSRKGTEFKTPDIYLRREILRIMGKHQFYPVSPYNPFPNSERQLYLPSLAMRSIKNVGREKIIVGPISLLEGMYLDSSDEKTSTLTLKIAKPEYRDTFFAITPTTAQETREGIAYEGHLLTVNQDGEETEGYPAYQIILLGLNAEINDRIVTGFNVVANYGDWESMTE